MGVAVLLGHGADAADHVGDEGEGPVEAEERPGAARRLRLPKNLPPLSIQEQIVGLNLVVGVAGLFIGEHRFDGLVVDRVPSKKFPQTSSQKTNEREGLPSRNLRQISILSWTSLWTKVKRRPSRGNSLQVPLLLLGGRGEGGG